MTDAVQMAATVEAYVAAFAKGDPAGITALFAPDATIEDPVGSEPILGGPAILGFYRRATDLGAKLRLDGPVRTSGASAAFAFTVTVPGQGQTTQIAVVDVFDFDEVGRIARMRAYWSEDNVTLLEDRPDFRSAESS